MKASANPEGLIEVCAKFRSQISGKIYSIADVPQTLEVAQRFLLIICSTFIVKVLPFALFEQLLKTTSRK
jgi:hypothetical protein